MSTAKVFKPWRESPSMSSSMEDFESNAFSLRPSLTPSTVRLRPERSPSASTYTDVTEDDVEESWSPPAWRKAGSGWFRPQTGLASPLRSRAATPDQGRSDENDDEGEDEDEDEDNDEDEDEDELTAAAGIPLPGSPTKGRSISRSLSPQRIAHSRLPPVSNLPGRNDRRSQSPSKSDQANNYIRISMRADVQHRTQPIEDAVTLVHKGYAHVTRSKYNSFMSLFSILLAVATTYLLFQSPFQPPAPDLIKVAGFAKSFEPLMYYSENGHAQMAELSDTGTAVWDLGESIRSTNMTSGPIIVKELETLSDSLKSLSLELTRFFANIDGDIDSILLVMEWTQRELRQSTAIPDSSLSTLFSNLHTVFRKVGVLENPWTGRQTSFGKLIQELFGQTAPQRTMSALQRTFKEFLNVLEEAISNEVSWSSNIYARFEAIDQRFLNLHRLVIRETDAQEREENEVLASLWSRLVGANHVQLLKFEKNKSLLSSLRKRTVENKTILHDHNGRLLVTRSNLEILRKKLVSPLVRSNESSTLSVDEQVRGLQGTYLALQALRDAQMARKHEIDYDMRVASRRTSFMRGEEAHEIEDR